MSGFYQIFVISIIIINQGQPLKYTVLPIGKKETKTQKDNLNNYITYTINETSGILNVRVKLEQI